MCGHTYKNKFSESVCQRLRWIIACSFHELMFFTGLWHVFMSSSQCQWMAYPFVLLLSQDFIYLDEEIISSLSFRRHPGFIAGSALQLQSFTKSATWEVPKRESTGGQSNIDDIGKRPNNKYYSYNPYWLLRTRCSAVSQDRLSHPTSWRATG